ncbi:MAG: excisionase family DNA-binding protein [Candidatus Omnitrophota bacterium]
MDDILTTRETAKYLKISEEYLRMLIRKRRIPAYKEGDRGGYRIRKIDIDKYISQRLKSR